MAFVKDVMKAALFAKMIQTHVLNAQMVITSTNSRDASNVEIIAKNAKILLIVQNANQSFI